VTENKCEIDANAEEAGKLSDEVGKVNDALNEILHELQSRQRESAELIDQKMK
jgi:hypothetical protein